MDKDKLVAALTALQEGTKDAGYYHDELETLIALVINAKDEDIAAAWEDVHTDNQETEQHRQKGAHSVQLNERLFCI